MEKSEILPPDEFAIETEMSDILDTGDRGPIARWSKIKYWKVCAMLRSDDPTTNPLYETAALIYGILKLNREKAKKVFNILYRYAFEWGLVDNQPADVIELARARLHSIERTEIAAMSDEDLTQSLAAVSELEDEASKVKGELIYQRGLRRAIPRNAELTGDELGGHVRGASFGANRREVTHVPVKANNG